MGRVETKHYGKMCCPKESSFCFPFLAPPPPKLVCNREVNGELESPINRQVLCSLNRPSQNTPKLLPHTELWISAQMAKLRNQAGPEWAVTWGESGQLTPNDSSTLKLECILKTNPFKTKSKAAPCWLVCILIWPCSQSSLRGRQECRVHGTLPTCLELYTALIGQCQNHSCCLYSCSVPMTPGRFWGLLEEISINQLQTDCYNFTLFFPSFHTFNEFGCLLNSKHLQSGQKKKNHRSPHPNKLSNTIGSSKTAKAPSRLSCWNWPCNQEWPPFGGWLSEIITRQQQSM